MSEILTALTTCTNQALVKSKVYTTETQETKIFPFECTHWMKKLSQILSKYYKPKLIVSHERINNRFQMGTA